MSNKNPKSAIQVGARRQRQTSHTDVDYVALRVDHNISIVPIFDLKDVASGRVRSHRLNEVQPNLLEGDRGTRKLG